MTSTQNGTVLEFAHIPYDKGGTYTCKAWNRGGMGQASIDLTVQYSPRIHPGWEIKSDVVGKIGKEASFELYIIANPAPATTGYVWSKDGNILSNSSPDYEIVSKSTGSNLTIKKVKSYDYTNYTCSVQTNGFQAKVFKFRLLKAEVPKMYIGVSRTDNIVTIRWKQVIEKYTAIKVKYCQTGTEYCGNHFVNDPGNTFTTFLVDPSEIYYYYVIFEDGGDVVYRSNRLVVDDSDAKTDRVAVLVGGILTGAVVLTATGIILAVALWKRRSRKKLDHKPAKDTNDDDATKNALTAIKNDPKHTYANVGTDYGNYASSHSKRPARQYPAKPRVKMHYVPVNLGDEPECPDDDVDINQYDYAYSTWQQDALGSRRNPVPACQPGQATWQLKVPAQIHVPCHLANQADPENSASSYDDMQDVEQFPSSERQGEQELEGTHNEVRTIATQKQLQQSTTNSGLGQMRRQHNASCSDFVPATQANQNDSINASSYRDTHEFGQNVSQDSSYDDVRIVTQGKLTDSTAEARFNQAAWQQSALGQNNVPACQANQNDPDDISSSEDMHELEQYVLCKRQRRQKVQEPEGTYDDVRHGVQGQPGQSTAECGISHACLGQESNPSRSNDDVAKGQQLLYAHLKPVTKHDYLDFKGLSPKQLRPQF